MKKASAIVASQQSGDYLFITKFKLVKQPAVFPFFLYAGLCRQTCTPRTSALSQAELFAFTI